ncbi:hypothetical protein B0H14DRAFT_3467580 [Mycena olivaceomarginata]|nr:hypothetical protein B0H14DRAFT_3467580 [Mycena olivaceomarginata]
MTWHSAEKYHPIWAPAAIIPTALVPFNIYLLFGHPNVTPGEIFMFLLMIAYIVTRIFQLIHCLNGRYFRLHVLYRLWQTAFLIVVFLLTLC